MDDPTSEQWLTVQDVATLFQVDQETVRRWVRRGDLPHLDVGGRGGYRFQRSDVMEFIDRKKQGRKTRRPEAEANETARVEPLARQDRNAKARES